MSVTGYMYNINATKKLGELELSEGLEGNRSWHNQFKHSAYIYIGGLHPGLTEGDVVIVFSQFGEIMDVNLIRDRSTGKSKGFCFICYEDQRSTILAVDNMNGYQLLKRTLRVDHVDKYKAPKEFDENDKDEDGDPKLLEYKATGAEGKGLGVYNVTSGQQKIDDVVKARKAATSKAVEDEDEAWAKAFDETLKAADGKKAKKKKKSKKEKKRDKKAAKADKKELKEIVKEIKRLKAETKKAKEKTKQLRAKRGGAKAEPSSSSSSDDADSGASDDSDAGAGARPKKRSKT